MDPKACRRPGPIPPKTRVNCTSLGKACGRGSSCALTAAVASKLRPGGWISHPRYTCKCVMLLRVRPIRATKLVSCEEYCALASVLGSIPAAMQHKIWGVESEHHTFIADKDGCVCV